MYDPESGVITVVAEAGSAPRSFVSASVLGTDLVLVAGGYDESITPTAAVRLVRIHPPVILYCGRRTRSTSWR